MLWFVGVIVFMVIILQAPVLVDVLRVVVPEYRISRLTSRATNFLLTFLGTFLFLVALGYLFFVFLPYLADDPNPLLTFKGLCHTAFAGWVWTNMVVNYYLAVFTHPGTEPDPPSEGADREAAGITSGERAEDLNGDSGVKKLADIDKDTLRQRVVDNRTTETETVAEPPQKVPPKQEVPQNGLQWQPKHSHFCKLCCNRVPYLDHHCPFTTNCVGYRNFSYFFLWLFYMNLGLGYAIWVVFPYFNQCLMADVWLRLGYEGQEKKELCTVLGGHSGIVVPIIGGFWVTWNMLWLQTILLLVDLSTYNVLTNITKLPVLRFAWHRLKGGKFLGPESRLRVLLLDQRPGLLWFLVPVINTKH